MNKVKCPKCRKILLRYKSELQIAEGNFIIGMECPGCGSLVEIDLNTDGENSNQKLKDESELEIQE